MFYTLHLNSGLRMQKTTTVCRYGADVVISLCQWPQYLPLPTRSPIHLFCNTTDVRISHSVHGAAKWIVWDLVGCRWCSFAGGAGIPHSFSKSTWWCASPSNRHACVKNTINNNAAIVVSCKKSGTHYATITVSTAATGRSIIAGKKRKEILLVRR